MIYRHALPKKLTIATAAALMVGSLAFAPAALAAEVGRIAALRRASRCSSRTARSSAVTPSS